ncbi:nitrogen regulation protein NR(II) [Polaromonas sp.]|uniref:two-component system sensor histidine kinase NtrB n=1 Tax=Polaromonas sp. TaxID=1869339 RepID=UPI0017F454A5|nr:PAS domain S-box protein [Polaromonas sp.]NMM07887.1 PAS domain S-box protein [Polaromonas sp.]
MKFPARRGVSWASRRGSLWALLMALVAALLVTLVWLSGRYESSLVQSRLEHDAAQTVADIRSGLTRNIQSFQALHPGESRPEAWQTQASGLLREHREIMRLEWRNEALDIVGLAETPYRRSVFEQLGRVSLQADVTPTCATARRLSGATYSASFFMPQADGLGLEVLDMCMPIMLAGRLSGYVVASYSLQDMLGELVGRQLARGVGLSFTEADGTRLALHGAPASGSRIYIAHQLLDLPGNTLVLRRESRLGTPALFPNVLTALVTAMSLALLAVLLLLARDMRRRQKAENELGEALAFRKAMEDSVLTGLRARDLQGRITYVNSAFCKMVGVDAKELLQQNVSSPLPVYWPPELAGAYQQRQETRLTGDTLPRERHESLFMRQDGTRFPVLIMEAPLINAVGKHTGWMSAILDVTEQRRVEELSRASQDRLQATARLAMVGEMASLLSHELNQPLAAISSYATGSLNLLQDQIAMADKDSAPVALAQPAAAGHLAAPLSEELQLAMRRIAEQAERAGKVIKSVHDFVRRRDREREAVAPRALLDAIMPLLSLQARKLGVRVLIEVDEACAPVLCDRTMVEQVLLNLSRNGMQAMQGAPEGPASAARSAQGGKLLTLRIRPAAADGPVRRVEFAVIDGGEGISASVAARLFTPFFTTKDEGMGLGLSLCRTVVEQHGGLLKFAALQPRGTIFSFTLAAAAPDTA